MNDTPRWTPGPWKIDRGHHSGRACGISAADANITNWRSISRAASNAGEANAHLIAASPLLYAELERVVTAMKTLKQMLAEQGAKWAFSDVYDRIEKAEAALAAARGGGS